MRCLRPNLTCFVLFILHSREVIYPLKCQNYQTDTGIEPPAAFIDNKTRCSRWSWTLANKHVIIIIRIWLLTWKMKKI